MPALAAIILAAGASTRMGRPKQLLTFEGQTLLHRAIRAAEAAGCSPIHVVLGFDADRIREALAGTAAQAVVNLNWEQGIGTSIRRGVEALLRENPETDRLLLMLCDQPYVTAGAIHALDIAQQRSNKPVCAASFDDTIGPPVIVAGALIRDLLTLPDDRGAKAIWIDRPEALLKVPCPAAAVDVDTPESYASLLNRDIGA